MNIIINYNSSSPKPWQWDHEGRLLMPNGERYKITLGLDRFEEEMDQTTRQSEQRIITSLFKKLYANLSIEKQKASFDGINIVLSPSKQLVSLKVIFEGKEETAEIALSKIEGLKEIYNKLFRRFSPFVPDDSLPSTKILKKLHEEQCIPDPIRVPMKNSNRAISPFEEVVEEEATVCQTIEIAKASIMRWKKLLSSVHSTRERKQINKEITYHTKQLRLAKQYLIENRIAGKTGPDKWGCTKRWLDSNYWRYLVKRYDNYHDAAKHYLSAPVNMRFQYLYDKNSDEKTGFIRVGVISDMRNGWWSLTDLMELQAANDSEREEIRQRMQQSLEKIKKKVRKKPNELLKQALAYAEKEIDRLFRSKQSLQTVIEEKQRVLSSQMLQLVIAQIQRNPHLIQNGSFHMAHLGLLYENAAKLHNMGWQHNERVEIENMQQIFEFFDGKKIQFSKKRAPCMTGDTIYLPKTKGISSKSPITLHTYYFNNAVQRDGQKGAFESLAGKILPLQQSVNRKALQRLEQFHPALAADLKQHLGVEDYTKNEIPYLVAENVTFDIINSNAVALSVGCLSAKDRTGFVGARTIQKLLEKANNWKNPKDNPNTGLLFDKNQSGPRVAKKNSGHAHMKVSPAILPGINKHHVWLTAKRWLKTGWVSHREGVIGKAIIPRKRRCYLPLEN